MALFAFPVLTPSSVANAPFLLYLCHRKQDLVAVAAATEGVTNVVDASTDLQGWSEDWYVTAARPPQFVPLKPAEWHARIDQAPLSVDRCQAGYQPSVIGTGIGDRRRVPEVRTRITTDWWPVYVDDASGTSDALAKAKARWVDPIYSAGRPMSLDEWIAFTGYREVKPAWFDPTPLPWAGLLKVGSCRTVTWRHLPVAIAAPYDAAIKVDSRSGNDGAGNRATASAFLPTLPRVGREVERL